MKLIKQGIVAVLLGALPVLAIAGNEESTTAISESSFGTLDADANGSLSKTELAAYPKLSKGFDTVDADTNGELSPAEFSALIATAKEKAM
jgi:hypothetical protein